MAPNQEGRAMSRHTLSTGVGLLLTLLAGAALAAPPEGAQSQDHKAEGQPEKAEGHKFEPFKSESVTSNGSVTIGGRAIAYEAVAGTIIVHPRGWDDVPTDPKSKGGEEGAEHNPTAVASMFYVAYFKKDGGTGRPVTFLYNGGPGSATLWLHMGAFGPRRVV